MTTTTTAEVARRKGSAPVAMTFADDLRAAILDELTASTSTRWPSPKYARDPVLFAREILGVEPWSAQVEILEAVRDHARVAVRSGHKIGKSNSAAILALWYWCAHEDARVVMTSTTARQVDQILWRELRMMRSRAGRCVACRTAHPSGPVPCPHAALIGGEIGELARTGLKSEDFREIVGFTAREAEAVAGVSGKHLLYIVDEASGVPDEIYEAIEGNRAGGARIVLFGNPTRTQGEHFLAFHSKKNLYKCITVSSESTPNVITGKPIVPGLATREWIEEKRQEWGETSPQYMVRIKGEHVLGEDGKIFSLHAITQSEERWYETEAAGRLFIGLDPAGATGLGDETAIVARRGLKMIALRTGHGLDEHGHEARILAMIDELALPRELPVIVMDRSGPIGTAVYSRLLMLAQGKRPRFELIGLIAGTRAMRKPQVYGTVRDELVANLAGWVRDGGAVMTDDKLAAEMHEFDWTEDVRAKLKATPKEQIRSKLKRSPDRFDALALACWEPLALSDDERPFAEAKPSRPRDDDDDLAPASLDPYSGGSTWR